MQQTVTAEINLHFDLHVPDGAKNAPLLIAVHGYAAHMTYMMREAKRIAPEEFVIASLQGPNKFFRPTADGQYKLAFGWLSDFKPEEQVALHHEFLLKVIDKLDKEGTIDRDRVFLYGFSQACALNFRFAFSNPDVLRGLIGVCGGIPSDMDTNFGYRPTDAEVLYIFSDDDEFYPISKLEGFDQRLNDFLPNYESKRYAAKHEITEVMRDDMRAWIKSKSRPEKARHSGSG